MTKAKLIGQHTSGSVYQSASAGNSLGRAKRRARWWLRAQILLAVVLIVGSLFSEVYRWHLLILAGVIACGHLAGVNSGYARGWQAAYVEQQKPLVRERRG